MTFPEGDTIPTGIIGVSAAEQARTSEFWDSFEHLERPPGWPPAVVARSANIAENRNRITETLLRGTGEWSFFVDDDQIFAPDTLLRLLARNVDVVSGLYLSRDFPFPPQMYDREDAKGVYPKPLTSAVEGMVDVLTTGAGCLLVRRRVLEALEPPWWTLGQMQADVWGDDVDFCRRVRAAGFKIHCDTDVIVGHKLTGTIWPQRAADGWWSMLFLGTSTSPVARFRPPG